ncbi:Aste57867_19264 [Aphanomyces stellatus]|uniref:Aste57867_19264 protein n=1 Tax=Aphanomyces stellatus TaxID=120398 RepID=A0A485LCB2_9STRA|nr:hypothetical protein As57867_019200 [Aphanomyces stellatus]VFT95984.1 Aste57867_19264 [Aphanomyces stellatus]
MVATSRPTAAVHAIAKQGFVNGSFYDKARPSFPVEALAHLIPSSLDRTSSHVLEIGSGTGKFTALLASVFDGDRLTTVEPVAGMRAAFAANFPAIPCVDGTAEHLPLADASHDAIYLAQTFHWCDNVEALTEMARVLRPRGVLGLVWNMEDDRTPWVAALRAIYQRFDGVAPQYRSGKWEAIFRDQTIFDYPLQHVQIERHVPVDGIDQIWHRVLSKSYVQSLSTDAIEDLKAEVYAILDTATFDRDADGKILYPYVTDAYVTTKSA